MEAPDDLATNAFGGVPAGRRDAPTPAVGGNAPGRRRGRHTAAAALLLLGVALAAACSRAAGEFDLQGHRGARGLAPENTLEGFAHALSVGVSTLEMDLAITADGEVVVTHDPRLNPDVTRTADGRWLDPPTPAVSELTLEELGAFDVGRIRPGTRYAARFSKQQPADGARIPTLRQVLDLVRRAGDESVRLNVEIKTSPLRPGLTVSPERFADAVVGVLREEGASDRVSIQSFDWRALKRVQAVAPEIPTVYLTVRQIWRDNVRTGEPGASPWTAGVDVDDHGGSLPHAVKAAGGHTWSPHHSELDAASLSTARRLGLRVVVWTVNDMRDMRRLLDMGVDGIITDFPDRLRWVLWAHGVVLPHAAPVSVPVENPSPPAT